jgi:hypothetical protein
MVDLCFKKVNLIFAGTKQNLAGGKNRLPKDGWPYHFERCKPTELIAQTTLNGIISENISL